MLNKTDLVWTRYLTNLINTKKKQKKLAFEFWKSKYGTD